jgi:AraC-like DNA-binding protein
MIISPFEIVCLALLFSSTLLLVMIYLFLRRTKLYKDQYIEFLALQEKYKLVNSGQLPPENLELELLDKMCFYIESNQCFLNTKLKVDDIALALNSSQREISQVLKQHRNQNFNSYINQYRIEEVIRIFNDSSNEHFKLESIAKMAGFGSKQSFYNTFESIVGVKPAIYRQKIADDLKAIK